MSAMKIGLALAQVGPFAEPASVTTMAEEAERRGYDELWVLDRPLGPVESVCPAPPTVRCRRSSARPYRRSRAAAEKELRSATAWKARSRRTVVHRRCMHR